MYFAHFVLFFVLVTFSLGFKKKVNIRGYHPGRCNKQNHGNLTMVKDREENDKLLVCSQENKAYVWKTTDGSNPIGEFFNPAYDCSDVLNKISGGAKNGFYWISLARVVPKKVWCDMFTDGGGWLLVGRKNSSVTWTVPSSSNPVEPFGDPHWSSSLGDAQIVDFRVQVATKKDFSTTRADWSFRLRKPRPLKNLLVINEGGCGRLSPGIGDISSVKDLQTKKVVSTKFRCSTFGNFYPKASRRGWDMMNYCLAHPCQYGFAFHHKYPIQIDYSGAFSYSASGRTSGISENSTAFVGCGNHKCCGCFGPIGGRKNYCDTQCKAKHGGTVLKSVYTWFWVRTSLPKKLWDNCMEYKVAVGNGKVVWYKLYDGSAVPVLGRCDQRKALINSGVVVVPDALAAEKVPPVAGLLKYRKDNEKLYIRSNGTWNVIGEEQKMQKAAILLNRSLVALESRLQNVTKIVRELQQEKAIIPFRARFTNLGATGRLGPTSLGSHYAGEDHEKMVTVRNGIQYWRVPYTGKYQITVVGAAGGYAVNCGSFAQGRGVYMRGDFFLNKGEVLKILIGQEGVKNKACYSTGGGGGTFIATSSNTPLIVAGGGGGMENLKIRMKNCDASTETSGRKNQCRRSCAIWPGGANGNGASKADTDNSGGGGGGFYSSGRSSKQFGGAYGNGGEGGRGFIQGGAGGRAWYNNAVGGFGGGGGAYGVGGGAGGGGGYSGGASGNNNHESCGGGGGSFNSGKNKLENEGYRSSGHGYVDIKRFA